MMAELTMAGLSIYTIAGLPWQVPDHSPLPMRPTRDRQASPPLLISAGRTSSASGSRADSDIELAT